MHSQSDTKGTKKGPQPLSFYGIRTTSLLCGGSSATAEMPGEPTGNMHVSPPGNTKVQIITLIPSGAHDCCRSTHGTPGICLRALGQGVLPTLSPHSEHIGNVVFGDTGTSRRLSFGPAGRRNDDGYRLRCPSVADAHVAVALVSSRGLLALEPSERRGCRPFSVERDLLPSLTFCCCLTARQASSGGTCSSPRSQQPNCR